MESEYGRRFWAIETLEEGQTVARLLQRRFPQVFESLSEIFEQADPLDVVYPGNPNEYSDVIREIIVLLAPVEGKIGLLTPGQIEHLVKEGLGRCFDDEPIERRVQDMVHMISARFRVLLYDRGRRHRPEAARRLDVGPDRPGNIDHDFYDQTAETAVLVHSCSPGEITGRGHSEFNGKGDLDMGAEQRRMTDRAGMHKRRRRGWRGIRQLRRSILRALLRRCGPGGWRGSLRGGGAGRGRKPGRRTLATAPR